MYTSIKDSQEQVHLGQGAGGPWPLQVVLNHQIFRKLNQKIFGLLLLRRIEVSNFIGKSLNLAPSTLQVASAQEISSTVLRGQWPPSAPLLCHCLLYGAMVYFALLYPAYVSMLQHKMQIKYSNFFVKDNTPNDAVL